MVTRLFSSWSEMWKKSPTEEGRDVSKLPIINGNDNNPQQSESQATLEKKAGAVKSDIGLQFINAESLDRAIVNRLQSRISTSVADALETRQSETGVTFRCTENETLLKNALQTENVKTDTSEIVEEATFMNTISVDEDEMPLPTLQNFQPLSDQMKESLHKMSDAAEGITANQTADEILAFVAEDLRSTFPAAAECGARRGETEEMTPEMYRNSQFNLENSSKEALCSNLTKMIPKGNIHSDTMLHLPLFGIPDLPDVHRKPSPKSSTETIILESASQVLTETRTKSKNKKKKRTISISPGRAPPYVLPHISATHIGDNFLETSINDIIDKGGDEFKSKYSSWIWDAFKTQLGTLKSLMLAEFNEKIQQALDDKEHDFLELRKRYRDKVAEFDATTDSFHQLMENTYKENKRVLMSRDFVIDKLKKEFIECKKHFEQDLQRQMTSFQREAETERLEMQKRNDELMLIMLTDVSKCGVEEAFKNEIESLHKMIKTLSTQNEILHKQLDENSTSVSISSKKVVENLEAQLDHSALEIMELRKTLQNVEREKEDLRVSYHQEIARLNRKVQELTTKYDHQLRDAANEAEIYRKKYARDTRELNQKMENQEIVYSAMVGQIKQQYGAKVENLSQAVSQLKTKLSGGSNPSRPSLMKN